MKNILLVGVLSALCSCTCVSSRAPVDPKPKTIVLPSHCETTELARFHRGEEILMVYGGKTSSTENQKKELNCMVLKSIGDGAKRYQIDKSSKPFGVSILDLDRLTVIRLVVQPSQGIVSKEVVVPENENKTLFTAHTFTFWASPRELAIAFGTDGLFSLPAINGGEGQITRAQFFYVLSSYIHSAVKQIGPENKKSNEK